MSNAPNLTETVCGTGGPCTLCVCAAAGTPIATPYGEVSIEALVVGALVYSMDHDALVAVPLARVHRAAVHRHRMVEVTLATGRTLSMSGPHPTADGRTFDELDAGEELDGIRIESVRLVPYDEPFTYDILPASDSGTYVAAGALVGSTLFTGPATPR